MREALAKHFVQRVNRDYGGKHRLDYAVGAGTGAQHFQALPKRADSQRIEEADVLDRFPFQIASERFRAAPQRERCGRRRNEWPFLDLGSRWQPV